MEKRSGSAAESGKKWQYSAVLSFLGPFVSPQEISGNMERGDEDNQAAGYDHPEDQGETAAAGQSETGGVLTSEATQQGIMLLFFYDEKSKLSCL